MTMGHRVAWLMNHHPDTRNSDIALQIRYWTTFEKDIVKGDYVALDASLYTLPTAKFPSKSASEDSE